MFQAAATDVLERMGEKYMYLCVCCGVDTVSELHKGSAQFS